MISSFQIIRIVFLYFFAINATVAFQKIDSPILNDIKDKADIIYDSLRTVLSNTEIDTVKINLMNEIAWNYVPTDFNKSMKFIDSALVLSREIGFEKGEAFALKNKGEAFRYKGELKIALLFHEKSMEKFDQLNDEIGMASVISNIGIDYYLLSDFAKAFEHYTKALDIFYKFNKEPQILKNLTLIGNLFYTFERIEKANEYYTNALVLARKINDEINIASQLANIGLIKLRENKYDESISMLKESLNIYKRNKDSYNYCKLCGNIGIAYSKKSEFATAERYFRKALNIAKKNADKRGIAIQYGNIGDLILMQYIKENEFLSDYRKQITLKQAEFYLSKSLSIHKNLSLIDFQIYSNKKLAELNEIKGNFNRAKEYLEISKKLEDSLFSFNNGMKIAEIEAMNKYREKNLEIDRLSRDFDKEKQTSSILIIIQILLVFSIVTVLYIYFRKWQKYKELKSNYDKHSLTERALIKDILNIMDSNNKKRRK